MIQAGGQWRWLRARGNGKDMFGEGCKGRLCWSGRVVGSKDAQSVPGGALRFGEDAHWSRRGWKG